MRRRLRPEHFENIFFRWRAVIRTAFLMTAVVAAASGSSADCVISRDSLRVDFSTAKEDGGGVARLLNQIQSQCATLSQWPAIVRAYYGALRTLEAKYSRNPVKKLSSLQQGMAFMDQAVWEEPDDVEVIFLRFAALHSMPSFLSDREKRTGDLKKIIRLLGRKDYRLADKLTQQDMAVFLLQSDRLNAEEMAMMAQLREELAER